MKDLRALSYHGLLQPILQEIRSRLVGQKISFKCTDSWAGSNRATFQSRHKNRCTQAPLSVFTTLLQGCIIALELNFKVFTLALGSCCCQKVYLRRRLSFEPPSSMAPPAYPALPSLFQRSERHPHPNQSLTAPQRYQLLQ